ncbi:hypothetical protein [Haliangium ochraceum]|uniref:hypothetical protein n=1 Tax=Haliangium ochraceum TaxID=80816 RepID=UPI00019BAE1B|nr:hypothetical protein [Haliangium ochraceum]
MPPAVSCDFGHHGDLAVAGDRLLIWQTAKPFDLPPAPGEQRAFDLAAANVGHYEFARIAATGATANTLILEARSPTATGPLAPKSYACPSFRSSPFP